jgi:hypothetical protein
MVDCSAAGRMEQAPLAVIDLLAPDGRIAHVR